MLIDVAGYLTILLPIILLLSQFRLAARNKVNLKSVAKTFCDNTVGAS